MTFNLGAILVFVLLSGIIYWFARVKNLNLKIVLGGWALKLGWTFLYVYIFSTYYGEGGRILGDSLNFLEDGKVLHEVWTTDKKTYLEILCGISGNEPEILQSQLQATNIWDYGDNGDWINDNRLIIRLNSLIEFFSGHNTYIHALFFSFLAYFGLMLTYLAFLRFVQRPALFLLSLLLWPSLAFWGSGITKESLLIFGMGLFFSSFFQVIYDRKLSHLVVLVTALLILLVNKPYTGLVLIPLFTYLALAKWMEWKKASILVFIGLLSSFAIVLTYTPEKFNLLEKVSYKQRDMVNIGKGGVYFVTDSSFCSFDYAYYSHFDTLGNNKIKVNQSTNGEYKLFGQSRFNSFEIHPSDSIYAIYLILKPSSSYFDTTPLEYKRIRLLTTIPECLVNTLIRPFPWDKGSALKYPVFGLNMALFALLIYAFLYRQNLNEHQFQLIAVLSIAAFIILLVIGWTSPVFGAIVRYKVPVDLLMLIIAFILLKNKTLTTNDKN